MRILIEKANDYGLTLRIAMVDYEKTFDSAVLWAVLNALSNNGIDPTYTNLIQFIYTHATSQIPTQIKMDKN